MNGAISRLIATKGQPVGVYNATGGGGREMPDYGDPDGTIRMIAEQRGRPRTITDSDGTETEVDLEFRCVPDDGDPALIPAGDGHPSLLEHPTGGRYRLLSTFPEDSGVLVLAVVED